MTIAEMVRCLLADQPVVLVLVDSSTIGLRVTGMNSAGGIKGTQ